MASNITQIATAIQNLNLNFTEINTSDLLNVAIQETNNNSNGLIGILIFIILCSSVTLYLIKFKSQFGIFDNFGLIFSASLIWIDIGIYLIIWKILISYQIFIFFYVSYFVLAFISLMRKELTNAET
jgi:hypothetical protein